MTASVRAAVAAGLLALTALSILRDMRPPRPVPAASPDTVFSAERAMRHVEAIAARPHPIGTADHDRVRDYIVAQLTALGVAPRLQVATGIGTRYQEAGRVQNIVAWLPGTTTNGKGVLLVAHYDGVGAGPGAGDDASGVAAQLETVRALRARKRPLVHDVFVLFTDGEEAGLLGAAAFAREHQWAKDVGVALNFDSRGTSGRSFMFETGRGNLSTVTALRGAGDLSAGSIYTAIYRLLPNDTDLSELAVLGVPAMNFAFTGGVLRYHTSHDDTTYLDRGSLQHQGAQMLALTERFGDGPLPLARTGDATFFDLPFLGMVVYPQWLALPLAGVALVLVLLLMRKPTRAMAIGFAFASLGVAAITAIASLVHVTGPAVWSGWTGVSVGAFALALNAVLYWWLRRTCDERSLQVAALVMWLAVAVVTALALPGGSYLFTWPLLFAAVAARSRSAVPQWVSAAVALAMIAGFVYGVSVVTLGVTSVGAATLAFFVSMLAWLLLPLLATLAGDARLAGAPALAIVGVLCAIVAALVARPSAASPMHANIVYAEQADSTGAWLAATGDYVSWLHGAIGELGPVPAWSPRLSDFGARARGRQIQRVALGAPTAKLLHDTTIAGHRRVAIRFMPPHGANALVLRGSGAPVLSASIDERIVDTTRYRFHGSAWTMQYWAPPDSGFLVALSLPIGARIDFDVAARTPGLPAISGLSVPPRSANVAAEGAGDVSVVYRHFRF